MKKSTFNLRKLLAATVITGVLLFGVPQVLANHDPNIIHACVNNRGGITIVNSPGDCRNPSDVTIALASEGATDLLQSQLDALQTQVNANSDKLYHFSRDGDDVFITGANLHVVNGMGTTEQTNSLGNIIIGYNEIRGGGEDNRNGSHMLVVGQGLNYSSFGGIVAGYYNEVSGNFASITGGGYSIASGAGSSVNGGSYNTASGYGSTVSGGKDNTASSDYSSISGGDFNEASGYISSVSGGQGNNASGDFASVSGGSANNATGEGSSVSGGSNNTAQGYWSTDSGGYANIAVGDYSSVNGGSENISSGEDSSILGGSNNEASGDFSTVIGGSNIQATGTLSVGGGGIGNPYLSKVWVGRLVSWSNNNGFPDGRVKYTWTEIYFTNLGSQEAHVVTHFFSKDGTFIEDWDFESEIAYPGQGSSSGNPVGPGRLQNGWLVLVSDQPITLVYEVLYTSYIGDAPYDISQEYGVIFPIDCAYPTGFEFVCDFIQ